MIEKYLKEYFEDKLDVPVCLEKPDGLVRPFIVIDVTGVRKIGEGVYVATAALQSYSHSKYEAEQLNKAVMRAADELVERMEIGGASLDTYTPFNDLSRKMYRYQAVYIIVFYDNEGGT